MLKATCMVMKNLDGYHKITFDTYAPALAWAKLPLVGGILVEQTRVRRPRSHVGALEYEFLGTEWESGD